MPPNTTKKERKKVEEKEGSDLKKEGGEGWMCWNLGVDAEAAVVPALFAGGEEEGMGGSAHP